jgi:DNA-directed RNA polymerase alpha subunit
MSINNIVQAGRVMWIEFKEDEYASLSILFSSQSGEKKKPDQQYAPSNTFSVRITGAYAKALSKYADMNTNLYVVATGKLGTPRVQSRNSEAEVAPLPILYADISITPIGDVSQDETPAASKKQTKKKKDPEAMADADTADLFD